MRSAVVWGYMQRGILIFLTIIFSDTFLAGDCPNGICPLSAASNPRDVGARTAADQARQAAQRERALANAKYEQAKQHELNALDLKSRAAAAADPAQQAQLLQEANNEESEQKKFEKEALDHFKKAELFENNAAQNQQAANAAGGGGGEKGGGSPPPPPPPPPPQQQKDSKKEDSKPPEQAQPTQPTQLQAPTQPSDKAQLVMPENTDNERAASKESDYLDQILAGIEKTSIPKTVTQEKATGDTQNQVAQIEPKKEELKPLEAISADQGKDSTGKSTGTDRGHQPAFVLAAGATGPGLGTGQSSANTVATTGAGAEIISARGMASIAAGASTTGGGSSGGSAGSGADGAALDGMLSSLMPGGGGGQNLEVGGSDGLISDRVSQKLNGNQSKANIFEFATYRYRVLAYGQGKISTHFRAIKK